MKRYIAQKADEALEAMCGRESLTERLKTAQMHFIFISDDHHLGSAPEHVRESITAFLKCKTGRGSMRAAALAKAAICSTLVEFGRQDALLSLSLKRKGKHVA
ncbi:MAG: hypothetical protein ABSD77_00040 [Verrucomicrobiota bacterium]|jgi:hypothetical protein